MRAIEVPYPLGQIGTVIRRGNPSATTGIDPVGGIAPKILPQHGGAVLQRDGKHAGFSARRKFQLVPQRIAHEVVRRRARCAPSRIRFSGLRAFDADEFCAVILYRGDQFLFLRVPPLVGQDSVAAGVTSSEKGGVSGSGAGVGIVVVTICEISAAIQKHTKATFAELVAIAFQIIATELVDHDNDNQLGASVVGGWEGGGDQAKQQQRHR